MKKVHLKFFLPLAVGVLVLLPALLITWLGYRAAQQATLDAAKAVMIQASLRASDAADADLAEPTRLFNYFSQFGGTEKAQPDPQNFTSLDRFEEVAWSAMHSTRLVKFIAFAPITGGYRAINVYDEDAAPEILVQEKNTDLRQRFRSHYPLDRRDLIQTEQQIYAPSARPWFGAAMAAADASGKGVDKRAWTDVYQSFSGKQLQVAHSTVVRNKKKEIIGVLALDVSFKLLGASLRNLEVSPNALAFIVDKRGQVVATSVESNLLEVSSVANTDVNSAVIRAALEKLPERTTILARNGAEKNSAKVAHPCLQTGVCESFQFDLNDKQYLAHALVLNQGGSVTSNALVRHQQEDVNFPDWRLVIAAPADDFNYVIKQRAQRTLMIALALAVLASILGVLFASRLNKTISAIAGAALKLGRTRQLDSEQIRTNFVEFQQISDELRHAADALQQSRDSLLLQNAELEQRVRERTIDLEHQTEQALQAVSAKAAFLATMSHEIRTPMNGVIGMADLLASTSLTAEQQDYVNTMRTSGNALLTIINDILDFSKIESGKMILECEPFSLQQMIEDCLALLANTANQKQLELLYEFDPDVPKFILGDITRVRQIVLNLLSNAVKFTDSGEVTVQVSKAVADPAKTDLWEIHVKDTGIGIPADRIDHLFTAFTQIDAATTRKYGGTGLGLAISRRLAELMGGGIRLQSEEGKGSVFTAQLQAEAFYDEATVNPNTSDMAAREQLKSVIGKRVLLIDQSETCARIMRQRLLDYQMDVTVVSDVTQITSHLQAANLDLDLIVIDVEHSPMTLSELHQLMQSSDQLAQVPVLALTMQADLHVNHKLNLGASDPACLLKPVRESHLTEALLQLLFVSKQMGKLKHEQEQERRQGIPSLGNRFPLRMLVVDDNPTNRKVAGMMLERLGYQTSSAVDGRDAVDQILAADARKQEFDVVWMDLHMPVLDGLESTKIVRGAHIAQPQIIAVTAAAMHGDKEICLQAGMNDYVSKPLESAELQAALERYLRAKGFEVRRNHERDSKDEADSESLLPEASNTSVAEAKQYFDPNRFMAFCEGNPAYRSTFIGLIQNMLKRGPEQFDSGWKAWDERRIEDAARVFHTMRGSMGTLGAGAFVEASRQIESAILAEQEAEVERLFVEVKAILETTLQEAQAWLNQQAES